MQKQIKDLKTAADYTGTKRKAEEEEEEGGDNLPGSSPAKKTLVTSDDSNDDDVQCLMIANNISKEAEIKEALRMMIIKPVKVDLKEAIHVKCPVEKEAILNLDDVKLKAKSDQDGTVETDHTDIDESVDAKDTDKSDAIIDLEPDMQESNVDPALAMGSKSAEEAPIAFEEKDVNLEMSWQLKKWPSLPSLLNRLLKST